MRKHFVVWQKVKEVERRFSNERLNEDIGGDIDANEVDPRRTMYNPDILPESANPYYIHDSAELNDKVHSLVKKAKKLLNKKEWEVFNLLTGWQGAPPMTQKDAALKMGVTQGRISQIWEDVRHKICEEWEL